MTGTSIEVDGTLGSLAGKLILQDGANLNNGQLTIDAGDQATLNGATITGGTITNNGTIDVTGAATFAGVTLNGAASGTGIIDNTGTLTIGSGGLTLAGSNYTLELNGSGTIALNGETIKSTFSDDTLVNNGNSIYGTGQIGTGKDGTQPLNVNNVSGTIEAIGGTLFISNGTFLTNSGLLEAANTGILDFTIGAIHNDGTNPLSSSNAGGILVDGTLEIDNPLSSSAAGSLSFGGNGQGVVALAGGTIEGNSTNAETLFNINNLILGNGHIGLGTDLLTLQNEAHGVINANVSGQVISIDTVATINIGTIEATGGGAVDFAGAITNSGSLTASYGSKLAFSNETIANTGSINADGLVAASQIIIHGMVTLDGGDGSSTGPGHVVLTGGLQDGIISDLHAATLINVDNTISGSGSVGDAYLTAENDQYGVIDATGILALNAISTVNAGLLEATSGGTLKIEGSVSNSGLIEANGGKVFVDSTATITGTASATITNGGVAEFVGSSTQTLVLNATFTGSGTLELDNSQHYGGKVSGFGAGDKIDLTDLTYSSSETDVWNSQTHTLTITEGTQSSSISFAGSYDQNSFALTSDANGHTEVVLSPAQASLSGLDHAGNGVEGFALGATLTDLNASGITYQWLDNGAAIAGATGSTYLPTAADLGKTLDVVVGFTDGSAEHVTALAGAVAAPPAVAINADGITLNENASLTLHTLDVSFGDAGNDSISVKLDVIHGTLALDNMAGLSESGSGTILSPFILTGTLSAIDTALSHGLVYTPTTGYYGSDTLTFEAHDGAFTSNTATATIDVAPPPVIVAESNPAPETIILPTSPTVLSAGTSTNSLGMNTETFDGLTAGSASNNGLGHGNFTSNALGATFTASGDAGIVHGSSSVSAAPFIGPSPGQADATNYLSIGAHGSETITFGSEQNEFGLYWGSADSFNTISFYDGNNLVASYSGTDVAPLLANGNQGSFASNGYVEFPDLAPFDKVVLASGSSNAFEIDNISSGYHVHLAAPISGTLTVSDADIGDTLTASVKGNGVAEYNGSTTLPSDANVSALIASSAITFDTVQTTGGKDVLDWTYNPGNADLDFLKSGDTLTLDVQCHRQRRACHHRGSAADCHAGRKRCGGR